jgi:hypothetical protein
MQKDCPSARLTSDSTLAIYHFLGSIDPEALYPAHKNVDPEVQLLLLSELQRDESTLAAAYGSSTGPDQPFVLALRSLVSERTDVTPRDVIKSFAMKPSSGTAFCGVSIRTMLAKFMRFYNNFRSFFSQTQINAVSVRKLLVSGLQPQWFQNNYRTNFSDAYSDTAYTLVAHITHIKKEVAAEETTNLRLGRRGFPSASAAATPVLAPSTASAAAVPPVAPVAQSSVAGMSPHPNLKGFSCYNCKDKVLFHFTKDCPSPCRGCKTNCETKSQCCREADGLPRRGAIFGSRVNFRARRSSVLSSSNVSVYRLEASLPADIIIDTGANALCIHREDYFSGKIKAVTEKITIADGAPVQIPGMGPVGACVGRHIPAFDKSLVPAAVITENSIIIVDSAGMNIIPSTPGTVESVRTIITESPSSLSMFVPAVNGLFPISKTQLDSLTISREEHARLLALVDQSAHTSYFTVKLDTVGELVKFWHETWKHASKKDMVKIITNKIFDDIPADLTVAAVNKNFDDHCVGCKKATLRETSKPQESTRVYRAGEGCAMDISYWTSSPDFSGNTFCCHSLDLGSGKSWEDPLASLAHLHKLIVTMHERYLDQGYLMEFIRVDKSFLTAETHNFCARRGITLLDKEVVEIPALLIEQPGPYEHAQNGSIECLIKCQVQDTFKVLESAQLVGSDGTRDDRFWSKAMRWVSDTRNRLPASDSLVSRNEAWGLSRTNLRIQPMMPFASRVLAHLPLKMQNNLSGRAIPCLYMGPAPGIKGGILLFNRDTERTMCRVSFKVLGQIDRQISPRDEVDIELSGEEGVDEYIYDDATGTVSSLYSTASSTPGVSLIPGVCPNPGVLVPAYRSVQSTELPKSQANYFKKIQMQFYDTASSTQERMCITDVCFDTTIKRGPGSRTPLYKFYDVVTFPGGPPLDPVKYEYMPCLTLLRAPSIFWDDQANRATMDAHVVAVAYFAEHQMSIPTEFEDVVEAYCGSMGVLVDDPVYVAMRADYLDQQNLPPPKNLTQMRSHPESEGYLGSWMRELSAFSKRGCDIPADLPIGDIPPDLILQLMPIFEKKYVGTDFSKFKCRMVVLGQHWKNKHGIDTFTTMVRMTTIKFLLSLGAITDSDWIIIDVKEAFLTTKVNRILPKRSILDPDPPDLTYYVRRPPGATDAEMPYLMKPEAFIYGHPLAGAAGVGFGGDLKRVLVDMGCIPTNFDSQVYTLENDGGTAIIAAAVDDMPTFLTGPPALKAYIIRELEKHYEITIGDPMCTVLGIEVTRYREQRTARLRQRGQMENLLNESLPAWASCDISDLAVIPAQPRHELSAADVLLDATPCTQTGIDRYNHEHGQLNWLLHTAPDFEQAVNERSRHLKSPSLYDAKCMAQVISCLARIRRLDLDGLIVGGTEGVKIISTVDTSYAGHKDFFSHTGGTLHMSHSTGAFMTLCKKLTVMADSAMVAEGLGAHMQIRHVLAYRYFAEELGFPMHLPSEFYMDNEPFMKTITGQRGCSSRSKHVLIQWKILKEAYDADQIQMLHLNTVNMVSDILTKPLAREDWYRLRAVLLGQSPMVLDTTAVLDAVAPPS